MVDLVPKVVEEVPKVVQLTAAHGGLNPVFRAHHRPNGSWGLRAKGRMRATTSRAASAAGACNEAPPSRPIVYCDDAQAKTPYIGCEAGSNHCRNGYKHYDEVGCEAKHYDEVGCEATHRQRRGGEMLGVLLPPHGAVAYRAPPFRPCGIVTPQRAPMAPILVFGTNIKLTLLNRFAPMWPMIDHNVPR